MRFRSRRPWSSKRRRSLVLSSGWRLCQRRQYPDHVTDVPQSPQPPSTEDVQEFTLKSAAPFRFDQVKSGVRIAVSDALPVSAGRQFEEWLTAAARELRPALRPFVPMVVAMMGGADSALATAPGDAAIVVWCRRRLWYSGSHPPVTVETLEHEAAHIYAIKTGKPQDDEWEATMRQDAANPGGPLTDILVLHDIATQYGRDEWIREDWAYSVQLSRDPKFATRFASRARFIAAVLQDQTPPPRSVAD